MKNKEVFKAWKIAAPICFMHSIICVFMGFIYHPDEVTFGSTFLWLFAMFGFCFTIFAILEFFHKQPEYEKEEDNCTE